jgi:ABC-2 type transport system ATP-binding protein
MTSQTTTQTNAPLLVDALNKRFGKQQALDNVSLSLQPGEIFGLVGLNGAGKTTMIKIILDLLSADSGQVHIFGEPAWNASSRQGLAYLPEKFQPSRYLKGFEYLDLAMSYYKRSLDKDAARAMAAALELDPEKLPLLVKNYSKGMGQKLGLIGAMLCDCPLLLLDEPMSGLDPAARIKLKAVLKAQKDAGKTLFFSSHILSDIDEICDRIGVIHHGKMLFVGTPAEFKQRHPASTLEHSFLAAIGEQDAARAA